MDQFQTENVSRGCLLKKKSCVKFQGKFLWGNVQTCLKFRHKQNVMNEIKKIYRTNQQAVRTNTLSTPGDYLCAFLDAGL